jgi:hypothetical protein
MGTVGDDTHPQPFLAFSHGDLLWGNGFPTSRFGQGAFQSAVRAVYEETSGRPLECVTFGKPQKLTYEYANELLKERVSLMGGNVQDDVSVWMVGDNPASDIAGANAFGWKSALVSWRFQINSERGILYCSSTDTLSSFQVRTGVYRPETGPPAHAPTIQVQNVLEAVEQALSLEWGTEK